MDIPSMIPIKIEGLGRYLPKRVVANEELEKKCGLPSGWILRRNGVSERRWADRKTETNAFMGARAAEEALSKAGISLSDIDLIINASGTPQQIIPETSPLIQYELGSQAYGVPCMSIVATCLSFVVALDTASSLLLSKRYSRILIVASDIASGNLDFDEPETSTLLGDAAAAAVVSLSPDGASGIEHARLETYSEGAGFTEVLGGGTYIAAHDHHNLNTSDFYFKMQGSNLLRMAAQLLPGFLDRLKPGLSKSLGDIDLIIPHQASKAGLKIGAKFSWPEEKIVKTLDFLGNTVAASIPTTLYEAERSGILKRGDRLLLLGTGAGLSIGGLVLVY